MKRFVHSRWALVLLFAVGAAVRLSYLAQASSQASFTVPIVDAAVYDQAAHRIQQEGLYPVLFYQPLFYPVWLSWVYQLFGSDPWTPRVFQALLGGLTCLLVVLLGTRVRDRATGLAAGGITALYMPLVFFEGELLGAGWAAFTGAALLLIVLRAGDGTWRWSLAAGLFCVFAVLVRPTFLPFSVLAAGWLVWKWVRQGPWKKRFGFLVLGMVLLAGPVMMLSAHYTGRASLLPFGGGINLYIGNHPVPCDVLTIRPGAEWNHLMELPNREGVYGLYEESAWFSQQARRFLSEQPAAFVRGMARKTVQFISSRELPRNVDPYLLSRDAWILKAGMWKWGGFGFPFGLLFPLAVVGWFGLLRRAPLPVLIYPVIYGAAVIAVFAAARYRIAVIPVLAVFGAAGAGMLFRAAATKRWKHVAVLILLISGMAALTAFPRAYCEESSNFEAERSRQVGMELAKKGFMEQAEGFYRHALSLEPALPDAHSGLGLILLQQEKPAEAEPHFRAVLETFPWHAHAWDSLGLALMYQDRDEEGMQCFRKALALKPDLITANHNLAVALARGGEKREAQKYFRVVLGRDPADLQVLQILVWITATLPDATDRELQDAEALLDRALKLGGRSDPYMLQAAAALYAALGKFSSAVEYQQQAVAVARATRSRAFETELLRDLEMLKAGKRIIE